MLGEAGVAHRKVEVLRREDRRRLAPGLAELGWQVECDVVMVASQGARPRSRSLRGRRGRARGARARLGGARTAVRVDIDDEEVIRQLAESKRVLASAIDTRFFAPAPTARSAPTASCTRMHGTGQIENVLTLEQFRNRGLARALVLRALAESSRDLGNDLTFLLANRDDWPKELYSKLGFDEVGSSTTSSALRPSSIADQGGNHGLRDFWDRLTGGDKSSVEEELEEDRVRSRRASRTTRDEGRQALEAFEAPTSRGPRSQRSASGPWRATACRGAPARRGRRASPRWPGRPPS